MRISVELDDMDEAEMKKERAKRDRLFYKKRGRDGEDSSNDFVATFLELAAAATDAQGLERFRWELMVENPALWTSAQVAELYKKLTMNGLKLLLQVLETRKDDMQTTSGSAAGAAFMGAFLVSKAYDSLQNYRAAVPWAELSLHYAHHFQFEDSADSLRGAYVFASMVQAKADMFTKSLTSFNLSLGHANASSPSVVHPARDTICREILEWTGSSGKLTAGI